MKVRTVLAASSLMLGAANMAPAQSVARMVGNDVSNAVRDFAGIWAKAAVRGPTGAHLDSPLRLSWEPFVGTSARDGGVRLGWQASF
jgi:hypothetical protein